MVRGAPPEVEPCEYERRLLRVFAQTDGVKAFGVRHIHIEDCWLEGEHPDTELAIVITRDDRPGCRYIFRTTIWRSSGNSNPEAQAADIHIGLSEWIGTLRSLPWTPGMTHEPRPARPGVTPRRPSTE